MSDVTPNPAAADQIPVQVAEASPNAVQDKPPAITETIAAEPKPADLCVGDDLTPFGLAGTACGVRVDPAGVSVLLSLEPGAAWIALPTV